MPTWLAPAIRGTKNKSVQYKYVPVLYAPGWKENDSELLWRSIVHPGGDQQACHMYTCCITGLQVHGHRRLARVT